MAESSTAVLDRPQAPTPQPTENIQTPPAQITKENFLDKARAILAGGKKPTEFTYTADTGAHGISQKGMNQYVNEQMEIRSGDGSQDDDALQTDPRFNAPMGVVEGVKADPKTTEAILKEVEQRLKAQGELNDGTQFTDPRIAEPLAVKTENGFLTEKGKGGEKITNMYVKSTVDSYAQKPQDELSTNPLPDAYKEFLNKAAEAQIDALLPKEYQKLLATIAERPPAERVQLEAVQETLREARNETDPVKRNKLINAAITGVAIFSALSTALIKRDSLPSYDAQTYTVPAGEAAITTDVGTVPTSSNFSVTGGLDSPVFGPTAPESNTNQEPTHADEEYTVKPGDSISLILNQETGGNKYGENYADQDLLYQDIGKVVSGNRNLFTGMPEARGEYYKDFYSGLDAKKQALGRDLTPSELKQYFIEKGGENQFFNIQPGDKLTLPGSVFPTKTQ